MKRMNEEKFLQRDACECFNQHNPTTWGIQRDVIKWTGKPSPVNPLTLWSDELYPNLMPEEDEIIVDTALEQTTAGNSRTNTLNFYRL